MTLKVACEQFETIMREIKTEDRNNFLKWIQLNWNIDALMNKDLLENEILSSIAAELRSVVPFDAIMPSEKIKLPVNGPNADCDIKTTLHVDEFLYDDEYIDNLIENGNFSRYYCGDCYSKNIKLLNFISHSMSISRVHYLFKYLLPPLKKEIILDVGSRLGPVLYGAYLYTNSSKIIGIEINSDFCKLQSKIIEKYNFSDRIQVICNSVFNEIEVLSSADVVILNNVFEFFADSDNIVSAWHMLAQNIKPGSLLVTIPHLEETFQHVQVLFNWKDWVEELQPFQKNNFICDDENMENHSQNVKHYKVKKKMKI